MTLWKSFLPPLPSRESRVTSRTARILAAGAASLTAAGLLAMCVSSSYWQVMDRWNEHQSRAAGDRTRPAANARALQGQPEGCTGEPAGAAAVFSLLSMEFGISALVPLACGGWFFGYRRFVWNKLLGARDEEELLTTEKQYATLFNALSDGAFLYYRRKDQISSSIQVNDTACRWLGYSREELLQKCALDLVPPDPPNKRAWLAEQWGTAGGCLFETTLMTKHGQPIPAEINAQVIEFCGRPAVLAIARDISERKRSEAALQASEQGLRRYIERNAATFLRTSLDGRVLDCNAAFLQMLGIESAEELKPAGIEQVYWDPRDRSVMIRDLLRHQSINNREIRWKRKDGEQIWALLNLTLISEGGVPMFVESTGFDITERKQMEKEFRTIAALVEASTDFIAYASIDGYPLFVNQAGRAMMGIGPNEPVGSAHIRDYLAEEDRDAHLNTVLPKILRDGH
jgi:PAS domain S-box-containing protein